jgi:GAF domain-containing protein
MEFFSAESREPEPALLEMLAGIGSQLGQFLDHKRAEAQLREQTQVAETLNRLGSTFAAALELPKIVQLVTDEATKLTDAEFGAFFYPEDVQQTTEKWDIAIRTRTPCEVEYQLQTPRE